MNNTVKSLPKEVKDKLRALDMVTEKLWGLPVNDPEYNDLHLIGKKLQQELIGHYGLTACQINEYTYGEGGILYE